MAELKDVLSDMINAQNKTISALKENRTKINNSVSSLNGAVGDINIENIQISLVDPGEYTAFEVTAGLTPIATGMTDAMTHAFQIMCARESVGVEYEDKSTIGTFDVIIDWGDGTQTKSSDLTMLSAGDTVTYDNEIYWSGGNSSYGYTYTDQTLLANYQHTYATPGTYKVKILGTTYYMFRSTVAYHRTRNLLSRCLEFDLPVYSGIKRLQGSFANAPQLKEIKCPSYYRWPDELIDCTSMLENCTNLVSLGDMKLTETVRSTSCLVKGCSSLLKGILVPDRTTNASQMYSGCASIQYIPNIGKNVQNIYNFAMQCFKCKVIDGKVPATTKYAKGAFVQTFELKQAPDIDSNTVFGWADDLDLTTLDEETYYNLNSVNATKHEAIKQMFDASGIITAPSNLGSVEGSNISAYRLFADCKFLKYTPIIPEGVVDCTSMCANCYSLELCGIEQNKTKFYNLNNSIPDSVTNLSYAFKDCYNLKSLPMLPAGLTNCSYMCQNCTSLTNVSSQLNACTALTNMDYTFNGCASLITGPAKLPATITSLFHTFDGCNNMVVCTASSSIAKMTGLTSLSYAFRDCFALQTLYFAIPDAVKDSSYAFYNCFTAYSLPYFSANSTCENCSYMYYSARKMENANIRAPKTATNLKCFMTNCVSSKTALNLLIANTFDNTGIDMYSAFQNCIGLVGNESLVNTIAPRLWDDENASTKFKNYDKAFSGITTDWINYVPTTWGGKKTES